MIPLLKKEHMSVPAIHVALVHFPSHAMQRRTLNASWTKALPLAGTTIGTSLLTRDRNHHALPRRDPERPLAAPVLRQNCKHAFRGAQDGAAVDERWHTGHRVMQPKAV